ncbi:general transcription factor II-I repeat domain-containing protein 2A-like [Galendromus occidentalis]|uniref:General transcription factor II-I repeat domain-containing protein 2A-like n=1 Tax=Galendromus occidentalis TaxID=34638 RepID=A0AAJ6QM10_9ACAR|nr:general transcription factor II-I repeat domain-containing protein 2A-like [Galendromus occidentalis]
MVGRKKGVVTRLQEHITREHPHAQPLARIHCIIHQEALCGKVIPMRHVVETVTKITNFIRARGLNHREFRTFLEQVGEGNGEILYYSNVRWLSCGLTLKCFWDVLDHVKTFLRRKNNSFDELSDEDWLTDFAFFVDLTSHLNALNLKLQGKGRLISEMYDCIRAFTAKLRLWQGAISRGSCAHFPHLAERGDHGLSRYESFVLILKSLETEVEKRFEDFRVLEDRMLLFSSPLTMDVAAAADSIQLELIEFQNNTDLRNKFATVEISRFFQSLSPVNYPRIHGNAINMLAVFGSTYLCEQYFSRMKNIKSATRSRMTVSSSSSVAHRHDLMRIGEFRGDEGHEASDVLHSQRMTEEISIVFLS